MIEIQPIKDALKLTPAQFETVKEGARILLFAVAAFILTSAGDWLGGFEQTETWVIAATFLLKLADKYVHKSESTDLNGIAPF